MTIRINWHLPAGGDIEIEHNGLSFDEGLVSLVYICLLLMRGQITATKYPMAPMTVAAGAVIPSAISNGAQSSG